MSDEKIFENILEEVKKKKEHPRLLLHCCCAPCSSACIERLLPFFNLTLYFDNPNIELEEEYEKRKQELISFAKIKQVDVLEEKYNPTSFQKISKGHEKDKEGGARCYLCYQLRLNNTALTAQKLGYDYFGTTLSISPFKNSKWINEIGLSLQEKIKIPFLVADFKKKNGYQRSIVLSKEYGLYRQDYCGCSYSKIEREKKKNDKRNEQK